MYAWFLKLLELSGSGPQPKAEIYRCDMVCDCQVSIEGDWLALLYIILLWRHHPACACHLDLELPGMDRLLAQGGKEVDLCRCLLGQRVAAHVLLWKSHGSSWVILTPDGDVYLEGFSGSGDPGCDCFRIKGLNFKYWSRAR